MKLFHLLDKYKWYIFSIVIIYIFFIILKYYNKNNKKNLQKNIINNDYFENKGKIITDNIIISTDSSKPNIHYTFNRLNKKNGTNMENKITTLNNIKKKQSYHPFVVKISNIIIGRYDLGKDKLLINKVYENVNSCIEKYTKNSNKELNDIITDSYKLNELLDKITLILSRILFKIVENPLTKILIGQYIIKKTDNNNEIDNIYLYFIDISKNTRLSIDERMNAIDMLNLSNNKKYIEISKTLLQNIRNYTRNDINNSSSITSNNFNNNLNRVVNNIKNKPVITNNTVTNTRNVPDLLVDRDGTTYPIPPDINVPPLNIRTIEVKKPLSSIYDDSQNVHNSTINQTTLNTAMELISKYNPENNKLDFVYYKTKSFEELPPVQVEKVEKSIHRINTDTATFGKGFTLYTLYQSLLNLIEKHTQKRDLEERLLDELIDMSGKCSTGHLSRIINVLQGFDTTLQVKVKININDEIYAKIKHLIEQGVINNDNMDEIMEDMLSENKTIYIKFIKDLIDTKIDEIIKEYENVNVNDIVGYNSDKKYNNISDIVTDIIIQSLDKYTGTNDKFSYLLKNKIK
jgi:hypothetical protein